MQKPALLLEINGNWPFSRRKTPISQVADIEIQNGQYVVLKNLGKILAFENYLANLMHSRAQNYMLTFFWPKSFSKS